MISTELITTGSIGRSMRPVGTFARQLTLGYGVALDRIAADYRDGVLTLTIPVAEEAKPRKIAVAHTGGATQIEGSVEEA